MRGHAELYRAFHPRYTPSEVDGMEMWQAAALLDIDLKPEMDDWEMTEADRARIESFATIPEDGDLTAQVMRQMGITPPT